MQDYETLSLREQRQQLQIEQKQDMEAIRLMDRNAYETLTNDTGVHDQFLESLELQLEELNQIRETGRPKELTPAQQESERYHHIGHFDKKERKKAAKEAAALMKKARKLHEKMRERPDQTAIGKTTQDTCAQG